MFQAVRKQSLSDEVFEQLRHRIVSRELAAGDTLPSERLLCELLRVNRGAVREALKRLQQAGLIQIRHGGATQVLDYRAAAGPELLPSLLISPEGELHVKVARSIVRMRQVLTPEIAADAASQGSPELQKELDSLLHEMLDNKTSAKQQVLAFQFWEQLVAGCGNIAYQLAFNSLRQAYEPIRELLLPLMAPDLKDLESFSAIAAAVLAADREAAFQAARHYIDQSSATINDFLDRYQHSN